MRSDKGHLDFAVPGSLEFWHCSPGAASQSPLSPECLAVYVARIPGSLLLRYSCLHLLHFPADGLERANNFLFLG